MQPTTSQFSLRSMLSTMLTVSMVLAYVRVFGSHGLLPAIVGCSVAIVAGMLVGWARGRLVEAVTWALVGNAIALCCVLSADRISLAQQLFWVCVAGITGAVAGSIQPRHWQQRIWTSVALAAIAAPLGMLVDNRSTQPEFVEMVLAPAAILGLMLLVEFVGQHQMRRRIALDVWAAGIIFAVIAGNFGAVVVWNLWYV
ncbi:hypothetical protein NA78x_003622 [Anatilimnocola sp. NA78]|uniref:hypothetical protein n=1 Tax=Anatilimnocola sp. NA78 TaxID=3415683 RepID=UPI003CE507FD